MERNNLVTLQYVKALTFFPRSNSIGESGVFFSGRGAKQSKQ